MDAEYLAVVKQLPWLPPEPIASFRRTHDPTASVVPPHITLVFPVPTSTVDAAHFREHVRGVISRTPSFEIRLKGFERSWDHWLFLLVAEGRDEVITLHDELYTGVLEPHLWTEQPFHPHVGLGVFVEEGDDQDLLEPRPRKLDREGFDKGLRDAEALDLDYKGPFDSVHIVVFGDDLRHVGPPEEVHLQNR